MNGPCMCGDLYCPSCGPAQGNHKCPNCGRWTDEGGCEKPEVCAEAERQWLADEAAQIQWEKDHAEEIERLLMGGDEH